MTYQKGRQRSARRTFGGGRGRKRGPRKENIHPSKFIKAAQDVVQEVYEARHTFDTLLLAPLLRENIAQRGFTVPSPIQDQAIPVGLEGGDVIGIANTGTGKTIAFAVPVIQRLLKERHSRVIIMAPTRELAQQILDEVQMLIRGASIPVALLIGGASMGPQLRSLARTPRIVIGTPGRIKDHIERKSLDLSTFTMVVLDEVDRMLDMGFVGDMRTILARLAQKRQSFFFSATMDARVRTLIDEFAHAPQVVSVKTGNTSDNVEQNIVKHTTTADKLEKLHNILIENRENKVLIFDETKRGADRLSKALQARGFRADAIHGNKTQRQRQRALDNFKKNHTDILVATDVAARGIDVPDITHVINYATPQSYADYVHRIGRAGRAGRTGIALTFIEERAKNSDSDYVQRQRSERTQSSHQNTHRKRHTQGSSRYAMRRRGRSNTRNMQ